MTKSVMMFIAFLLILPILPWLPLGITFKGKMIIALESFAIASMIMLAVSYVPWWQGLLLSVLIIALTGYFTMKYGLPAWVAETVEEQEENEERISEIKPKTSVLSFSKQKWTKPQPEEQVHTDNPSALLLKSSDVETIHTEDKPLEVIEESSGTQNETESDLLPELPWENDQQEEAATQEIEVQEEAVLAEKKPQAASLPEFEEQKEESEDWLEQLELQEDPLVESDENEEDYLSELLEEPVNAEQESVKQEALPLQEKESDEEKEDVHYLAELFEEESAEEKLPELEEWETDLLLSELESDRAEVESLPELEKVEEDDEEFMPVLVFDEKESIEDTESSLEMEEKEFSEQEPEKPAEEKELLASFDENPKAELGEHPSLSPEWMRVISQEIAWKQEKLPFKEAEEVTRRYLNAPLNDRDYYTIARTLIAFYAANGETLQAMLFADEVKGRIQAYPALTEEVEYMKRYIIKQSMETGE